MTNGPTRRRATVMFIDMVGYSRLMHRDEPRALALIRDLEGRLRERLPAHGGALVKLLGDGSIAVFDRPRNAVEFAVGLQRALAARNAVTPPEDRFRLRIGIHAGEIVEEAGDVLGDAVNIAARLQPLADPGGIAMSAPVHDEVRDWTDARGLTRRGVRLKNIAHPATVHFVPPPGTSFALWTLSRRRSALGRTAVVLAVAAAAIVFVRHRRMQDVPLPPLDDPAGWRLDTPPGTTAWIASGAGREDSAGLRITYKSRDEHWSVIRRMDGPLPTDWSSFAALRMSYRSSGGLGVAVELVEQGRDGGHGEGWIYRLPPASARTSAVLPFAGFTPNTFGNPSAPFEPGTLNPERIRELRVLADGTGDFNLLEVGSFALVREGTDRGGEAESSGRGRPLASLTSLDDLWPFATGGSTVLVSAGDEPPGAFIRYRKAAPESAWGVIVNPSKAGPDWSAAAGLRIRIRGTPGNEIYVSVIERSLQDGATEGEQWGFPVVTADAERALIIPFSQMLRGSWQPAGADNDSELDRSRVLRLQLGGSTLALGGSCFVSSIELVGAEAVPVSGAPPVSGSGSGSR